MKDDKDIQNNYAYAVGGQDVFNIPDLKARSDTNEETVTDNSPVVEDLEEQIPEDVGENDRGVEGGDDDDDDGDGEVEEEIQDGDGGH